MTRTHIAPPEIQDGDVWLQCLGNRASCSKVRIWPSLELPTRERGNGYVFTIPLVATRVFADALIVYSDVMQQANKNVAKSFHHCHVEVLPDDKGLLERFGTFVCEGWHSVIVRMDASGTLCYDVVLAEDGDDALRCNAMDSGESMLLQDWQERLSMACERALQPRTGILLHNATVACGPYNEIWVTSLLHGRRRLFKLLQGWWVLPFGFRSTEEKSALLHGPWSSVAEQTTEIKDAIPWLAISTAGVDRTFCDTLANSGLTTCWQSGAKFRRPFLFEQLFVFCLAFSEVLPPYAILWILDWLPGMSLCKHHEKIHLIENLRASIRKVRERRIENDNKKNRVN